MKIVPLKELKIRLSYWVEQAAKGEPIQITRYNHPYVTLSKAANSGLHVGANVGRYEFKSVIKKNTGGKVFEILAEDREDRF